MPQAILGPGAKGLTIFFVKPKNVRKQNGSVLEVKPLIIIQDPKLMTARQRALKANTSAGTDVSGQPLLTDPPIMAVVDHIS